MEVFGGISWPGSHFPECRRVGNVNRVGRVTLGHLTLWHRTLGVIIVWLVDRETLERTHLQTVELGQDFPGRVRWRFVWTFAAVVVALKLVRILLEVFVVGVHAGAPQELSVFAVQELQLLFAGRENQSVELELVTFKIHVNLLELIYFSVSFYFQPLIDFEDCIKDQTVTKRLCQNFIR